jgi:hypothetical protein
MLLLCGVGFAEGWESFWNVPNSNAATFNTVMVIPQQHPVLYSFSWRTCGRAAEHAGVRLTSHGSFQEHFFRA